ncbi:MAG: protein kinase, partial [Caldimonas sp.]
MQIPERLGKYLIRRELGRGAMGIVYEGYDPLIERAVAIKVLRLDDANAELDSELRLRFRREAQAAGRLSHPGIVAVYEYGEEAGTNSAFIAMELVEGHDLKGRFDAGQRFSLAETGRIMDDLLGALQHAHERGVVHRDIKPANIILLADGSVKVADFGIAKLDTSELTQLGSVLGTVSHMSPEQLTGEAVDRRSDLFSCAVILYQLLTGARAFTGSPATVMHKVLHEQPPAPSTLVATLPRGLDAVVRKAMAKAPAERYPSAVEFASALRSALASLADPDATVKLARAPGARPGPPRKALVGGVLGALVLLAAAAWVVLKPARSPGLPPAVEAAASAAAPASAAPPADLLAAASPVPASAIGAVAAAASGAATASAPAPSTPAAQVGPDPAEIEQQAWDDAMRANSSAAFEAYLKGYPHGRFAARARIRIAALAPRPTPTPAPGPGPGPGPAPTPTLNAAAPRSPAPGTAPVVPPPASAIAARANESKPAA